MTIASRKGMVGSVAPFKTFHVQMDSMVGTYRVTVEPVPSPLQSLREIAQEQCDQAWFIEEAIRDKLEGLKCR